MAGKSEDSAFLIRQDVRQARHRVQRVIITFMHWGTEYSRKPDSYQEKVATWCGMPKLILFWAVIRMCYSQPADILHGMLQLIPVSLYGLWVISYPTSETVIPYEGTVWHIGIEKNWLQERFA